MRVYTPIPVSPAVQGWPSLHYIILWSRPFNVAGVAALFSAAPASVLFVLAAWAPARAAATALVTWPNNAPVFLSSLEGRLIVNT